jgi:antitoxin component of MazEF toxin-antitoxin module
MIKKLNTYGNSKALTVNKTMQEHLGVTDEVEVKLVEGGILLKKPDSAAYSEAKKFAKAYALKHDKAMRELAK